MRYLFPLFLLLSCLLALLPGCEPKENLVQTTGSLELQADTVLFDTVFTTIKTVTKRLWVYNRNGGAVRTDISLAGGAAGNPYSLVINGDAGPAATNVLIRGNDSLLVLVRAVLGDNGLATAPKKFLVTDELHFRTNGADQVAHLVAYGQNAYFHRADEISSDVTWRTDKPHVIINGPYGPAGQRYLVGVVVRRNVTLTIPKGARIYSHAGALLEVDGRLLVGQDFAPTDTVKASNANIVRFQGDRLEPFYNNIPGQWGGILFTSTSTGSLIRYAEIKNATFGALLYNPDYKAVPRPKVVFDNTVFRNISGASLSFANAQASTGGGVISYSGDVTATNCLFTNCGEYAVLALGGGTYNFNFCTFANYTPAFRRETPSLYFTNEQATDAAVRRPLTLQLHNSIVWGSNLSTGGSVGIDDELVVNNYAEYPAGNLSIRNTLLRTKMYATTPQVVGDASANNLLNVDPQFVNTPLTPGTSNRPADYRLRDASPAVRRTPPAGSTVPARDLQNLPRPTPPQTQPSLGAYEHK